MNLPYTHALLSAANEQRHDFTGLTGSCADQEVRLMVAAGLVDATVNNGGPGAFTSINRITAAGHTFLRAFAGHHFSSVEETERPAGDSRPITAHKHVG